MKRPAGYVGRNEPHIYVSIEFKCNDRRVGWPIHRSLPVKWLKKALKQMEKCEMGACLVTDATNPKRVYPKKFWYSARVKP